MTEGEEDVMAKTTKRREVWVNIHDGGENGDYATAWLNRKAAKTNSGVRVRAVAVPFIEARPGDVVLSREDAAALRLLADSKGHSNEALDWENVPALPSCSKCGGSGKYEWQDGHNGDDHESACPCTSKVTVTVASALAPFRGGR